jgi:hypothetical protein
MGTSTHWKIFPIKSCFAKLSVTSIQKAHSEGNA